MVAGIAGGVVVEFREYILWALVKAEAGACEAVGVLWIDVVSRTGLSVVG